jgi:hypothetical protein
MLKLGFSFQVNGPRWIFISVSFLFFFFFLHGYLLNDFFMDKYNFPIITLFFENLINDEDIICTKIVIGLPRCWLPIQRE